MTFDLTDPIRTFRSGRPVWLWPDGKVLPVVSGGEGGAGDGGGAGGAGGGGSGSGGAGDGGSGSGSGSGETGDTFPANTPVAEMTEKQQVAYWKHQSRKHESRAEARKDYDDIKAKAEKYEQLEGASKTEHEQAIEAAKAESADAVRKEERGKTALKLVDAEMKAAAAGRLPAEQLQKIIDPLDRSKFLTAEGEVDEQKVIDFIASVAPAKPNAKGGKFPDTGQGRRGEGGEGKPTIQSGRDRYQARHGRKPAPQATTP